MNELNQRWRTYKTGVIPRDAPAIQMIESRRAFFAGAAAIAEIMTRLDGAPGTKQVLEDLNLEIRQFRLEVAGDRA